MIKSKTLNRLATDLYSFRVSNVLFNGKTNLLEMNMSCIDDTDDFEEQERRNKKRYKRYEKKYSVFTKLLHDAEYLDFKFEVY